MRASKKVRGRCFIQMILWVLLAACSAAYCNTYYVDPNGDDGNSGTIDSPFATITYAMSKMSAGDTIYLRGGRHYYSAKISLSKKSGSAIAMYNLFAYPGDANRPILDFSAMEYNSSNRGISLSGQYWHIKGIDIYKAGDNGMIISGPYPKGSDNIIENCAFYENYDSGLQIDNGATNNRIINCDSYYNYDPSTKPTDKDGGDADGFAPKITIGTGNYFYGCRAWQNSDDGYDGYLKTTGTSYPDDMTTTFENCWSFRNGYLKDGSECEGNGNGFKMGGSDTKNERHNMIFKNCLCFENKAKGFDENSNKGSMTLYNCTAFDNGAYNYYMPSELASGKTAKVTNCVSFGSWGEEIGYFVLEATNSWLSPFLVTSDDFISVDISEAYGPRKADGSLPDISFMHLAPGSDLIDGGTIIGLPYKGQAPDLGCFEADAPNRASNPNPASGTTHVYLTPTLSWTAGDGAESHDVYFGTVNPPPFIGNQAGTTYSPAALAIDTVYYWRIDEKNAFTKTSGPVWAFVTFDSLTGFTAPYSQWTKKYNGTADSSDYAMDITVDSAGNAYVTGYGKDVGKNYGFATVKYDPAGNVVPPWPKTYNRRSTSYDYAMAIAVDAGSNIIVAGYNYTTTSGYDGAVVKYDSAGNQIWAVSYNSSGTADDRFYDVAADANGDIYAVGRSNGDSLIVKYTSAGAYEWTKTYNGSGSGFDSLYQVAIADDGNVYACGESAGAGTGQDCLIVKYAPDDGNSLWVETYNSEADGEDWLNALVLDSAGNVYVTGSADSDYITMKYSADGNLPLWTTSYRGAVSGWNEAYAITIDSGGSIVVTGYSEGSSTSADAATVKYNSATGSQIWDARYDGAGNWTDYAEAIAADAMGNVYIHGRSFEKMDSLDYLTICYDSDGAEKWKRIYNGPALKTDTGCAIALYGTDSVYVTGSSMDTSSHYDYATVKYTMESCPASLVSDLNGDCYITFADFGIFADGYVCSAQDMLILEDMAENWLECVLLDGNCRQ